MEGNFCSAGAGGDRGRKRHVCRPGRDKALSARLRGSLHVGNYALCSPRGQETGIESRRDLRGVKI